jgi:periplasmic divalent cation tolerance protein
MQPTIACILAMVTAPDMETARKIATAALQERLVACANLVSQIESHYWWEGKLETSSEVLILFKTVAGNEASLRKSVIANHPYKTPEFVVLKIDSGSAEYLGWICESVLL